MPGSKREPGPSGKAAVVGRAAQGGGTEVRPEAARSAPGAHAARRSARLEGLRFRRTGMSAGRSGRLGWGEEEQRLIQK